MHLNLINLSHGNLESVKIFKTFLFRELNAVGQNPGVDTFNYKSLCDFHQLAGEKNIRSGTYKFITIQGNIYHRRQYHPTQLRRGQSLRQWDAESAFLSTTHSHLW